MEYVFENYHMSDVIIALEYVYQNRICPAVLFGINPLHPSGYNYHTEMLPH